MPNVAWCATPVTAVYHEALMSFRFAQPTGPPLHPAWVSLDLDHLQPLFKMVGKHNKMDRPSTCSSQ